MIGKWCRLWQHPAVLARRAKVVCTLGPASTDAATIQALVAAGMDVARLNLSYGRAEDHAAVAQRVREVAADAGRPVAVLADLQGPKIRIGALDGERRLEVGQLVQLADADAAGEAGATGSEGEILATTHQALSRDARPGDPLLLRDGTIRTTVESVADGVVTVRVVVGGTVKTGSGINLPSSDVTAPALTAKDAADLEAALRFGADLVALSFVRSPDDAVAVRAVMDRVGRRVPVIAKIEKPQAVERIDALVQAFDGVMVARGDLGVEIDLTRVPLIQKAVVDRCRYWAKPVIVATEMLESMIDRSRPTRAEASDVVNAVLDGADALMLSAETSMGVDPVRAARTMSQLIETAERDGPPLRPRSFPHGDLAEAVVAGAVEIAGAIGAAAIVVVTGTGSTAQRVAAHRPDTRIVVIGRGAVPEPSLLLWGTETGRSQVGPEALAADLRPLLAAHHDVGPHDTLVVVTGERPGSTNLVWVLGPDDQGRTS
jgi:pyruvate kinase